MNENFSINIIASTLRALEALAVMPVPLRKAFFVEVF
jgi:hypothetical protein